MDHCQLEISDVRKKNHLNCWNRKSRQQRWILISIAMILVGILSIFFIVFGLATTSKARLSSSKLQICSTVLCKETAAEIRMAMNASGNPCNNFYNFVCGNWSSKYPVKDKDLSSSTFANVRNQVTKNIIDILQAIDLELNTTEGILNNALRFYKRCQDTDQMNRNGVGPLVKVLRKYIGGWPLVEEDWNNTNFDLNLALVGLYRLGLMNLVDINVIEDLKTGSQFVFMLDQPKTFSFGLDWGTLVKIAATGHIAMRLDRYKHYIQHSVNVLLGIPNNVQMQDMRISDEVHDLVGFERLLAQTISPPGTRRNVRLLLNESTVEELQRQLSQWQPSKVFRDIAKDVKISVSSDDKIYPVGLPYLKDLDKILQRTPKRTVANFIGWVMVRNFGPFTVKPFREAQTIFLRTTEGISEKKSDEESCVIKTIDRLPFALVSDYVREHISIDMKQQVKYMIDKVKESVLVGLKRLDWMDSETKEAAISKVSNVVDFVAYPDWILDDDQLIEHHQNIMKELDESETFLDDIIKTKQYTSNLKTALLKTKPDRTKWGEGYLYPLATNAEYHNTNSIRIMAGILGKALFHGDRPDALNYGSMGAVIGHEIIHGLDDRGSSFDQNGLLRDWWQNSTKHNYLLKTECIRNQYGNITDQRTNLKLNGLNTLGENIADNGGIRQAYRAFLDLSQNQPETTLINFESYSGNQLFFLSYAHTFCEDYRESYAVSRIQQETHSLSQYRVNVPLRNFEEFAKVFHCPKGSEMNPIKKCSVWI